MAEIEAKKNVRSTYHFMLRSCNYNLLNGENIRKIRLISDLEHDIGLHYSDTPEDRNRADSTALCDAIKRDWEILKAETGLTISTFSFHNPIDLSSDPLRINQLINTYDDPYFKDISYISESNFDWQSGCPSETFVDKPFERVQVLIQNVIRVAHARRHLRERVPTHVVNRVHHRSDDVIASSRKRVLGRPELDEQ